jgi:hypothetical protein
MGKISKASIAAGVAASTFGLCAPVLAQERSEPSTVVVYGDASRYWVYAVDGLSGSIIHEKSMAMLVGSPAAGRFTSNCFKSKIPPNIFCHRNR